MGEFKRHFIAKKEPAKREPAKKEIVNPMTLAKLDIQNQYVLCGCNRCGHSVDIDLSPLINRLGPLFPVAKLGGRIRCTSCQSHDVTTCPSWPHATEQMALHG